MPKLKITRKSFKILAHKSEGTLKTIWAKLKAINICKCSSDLEE